MESGLLSGVRTERTNFEDGNWEDICPHCGQVQHTHREIHGPHNGVLYEHRMPCEPEKDKMRQKQRNFVWSVRVMILVGWILVPLAFLLLQQFVAVVGWIAFGIGIIQLGITTIKHFGNPDRWIPGHKQRMEADREKAHWVWHCKRNPEGFARLRSENFERQEREEEEKRAKARQNRERQMIASP